MYHRIHECVHTARGAAGLWDTVNVHGIPVGYGWIPWEVVQSTVGHRGTPRDTGVKNRLPKPQESRQSGPIIGVENRNDRG